MKSICIFLGANPGNSPKYKIAAQKVGKELAQRNITVIYGGSDVGLMGALANSALEAGGKVIGVIPESLANKDVAHHGLTELHITKNMHERKKIMADLADGFIAIPGGIGTLEEIFEIFTWAQLGFHKKPCGLLNIDGYYDILNTFLNSVVNEGFLKKEHKDMLINRDSIDDLITAFEKYTPPTISKWVEKD